jgi:hypothetical protein
MRGTGCPHQKPRSFQIRLSQHQSSHRVLNPKAVLRKKKTFEEESCKGETGKCRHRAMR